MSYDNFNGLSELEIIRLINRKKSRYAAMTLTDLEELVLDKELFRQVRKIVLDNLNGFTRSLFAVVGVDVEGIKDE